VDLQAKIAAGTTLEKYGQGTLRFDFTNSNSIDRTKKSQDLLTTIRIVEGIWELSRDGGYQPSTPFINNAVGSSIVLEDGAKWHIYGDCFWAGHDGNFSKVFTTTIKEGAELVWKTGQGNQVSLGPTTLLGGRLVNDVNTGDSSVANRFVIEDITVNALPGATSSAPTESILGGVGFGFNMSYGDAPTVTFTVAENALLSVTTSLRNSYKPGTSGVSSIVKAGAGKMVLSDARSSFTGATTINGGTLSIAVDNSMASAPGYTVNGSGSALELLDNAVLHATAPISLNAGGTLRFDRTSAISLPNAVTGAGNIRKSGAGSTATLTNAAGFTGAFQVDANGGTLAVTTAWPANSASVEIGAGGVLTFLDGSTRKNIVLNNANASFAGRKGTPAADISGNLALTGGHVLHIADPSLATSGALSTGTLTIDGSLSLGVATLVFDVNSATDHDKLVLSNGILSFNSGAKPALSFNFLDDRAPDADFDILSLSGSAANTLAGILTSDPTAKLDFLISGAPVDPDVHQLLFSYKDNGNTLSMSVEDAPTIFYWAGATGNWDKSATTLAWSKDGTSAPAAYRDRLITRFSVAKQGTGAIPATLATDIQISDVIVPRAYKVTNPQVGITIEDGTFTFTNTTGRISGETWLDLGAGAKLTLAVANAGSSANDFTGAINLAAGARLVADNAGADSVPVISNTNVPSLLGTGKTDNSTYFTGFTLDTGATLSLNNASTTLLNTSDRPFRFAGDSATLESTSATGKGVYLTGAFSYSAAKAAAATAFTLNLGGAGVGSISSVLADNGSGALSIVKTGAGKWTLSNNGNLFSGGVAISGGTLEVGRLFTETAGDPAPLGKGNVGRTLTLNTGGQLRYTGRASNNAAGGKLWFNIAGDGTGTIDIAEADARVEAGTIQSGFTKDGAGTLLLPNGSHAVGSGQDVTVKQGALLLAGTLDVKDNTIEVKSAGGLYLQDDARINNTALLNLSEAGAKFDLRGKSETIQKLDGAAGTLITNTGARDLSATVAGNPGGADAASTLRISGDHSGTFAGVIADDSAADASRVLNLEVVGDIWTYSSPEQTLSGINTYTGSTTIGTLATLKLSGTGSIAQSSGVIFSGSSGTFDITAVDTSTTIKGISSSSTATINLGSKTLVIKPESAASTLVYSGLISALAGGNFVYEGMTATSGSVFATGASSRLQLKAANNSYKGSAGIKGGILELASASGTPRAYAVFNRNDTVTVTVEGPTSAQPSAPTGYLLLSATGSNVFANKLSGTGAVVATGSTQALGLTADNTAFTGTFMARDGATLLANATATAANFGVVSGAGATIQLGGVIAADGAGKFKYEGGAASQLQLAGLALGAASNEIEVVNAGATLGFAGTFSTVGSGPQLVKKGAGALVFSGTASAASVPIRVDAGQLGIVNTSSAGTGDITFNAGSTTLSLGSAATTGAALTFQNNLSSADLGGGAFARGTLLVDSPVTATVTGSNSGFHGDVVVRGGGTVAVSSLSALGALDNTLTLGGNGGAGDMGSGTLRLSGTFALGSRDINLGSQGAFIDAATAVTNAFHSGRLSGAGFEKLGPGSFSLSAAASVNAGWAGAIKISGGILTLVNTGSAGTGGITLNGVSASSATLRLGFIDTQSAGLDSTTGAAMDFTQALASASGGSGTLLVDSPVTVTMSGAANASTFEGRVVVRGDGLLSVSSADALGAASNTLFLGGAVSGDETGSGTLRATASLDLASRNVILGSANSGYVETVGDTTRVVHSGTLSGGTLRKLGTGILALHGDNSAFAGAVEVRAGVLEIAGSTAIAGAHGVDSLGAGKLTLGFGTGASAVSATLRVAANSGSLAYAVAGDANLPANTVALSGLGGVFDIGADSSLALSKHVSSPGFTAGLDSGNIPHASVLTKSGQGELVLSSDNSAVFSGNATVQGGVLTLAHESALGLNNESSAPAVTVAAGGVLRISAAPQNWRGALLGAGEVHVADAVATVLGFEGNTLSGAWRATAGASITATAPAAFGSASFILGGDAGSAAASPLDGFSGAGALVLNFAADANAASDWNTATTASPQGSGALPTYVIGAGRALSLRAAGGSVEIPAGVAVEFQGLVHSAATAGADAATEGALTKLGAGVLVLANAGNAVTAKGALNISAGMVEAVDAAAIPGGPLTLGSASALGTLRVDASGALASTAIVISGKGGVLDVSGDTTTLSTGRALAASALDAGAGLAKEGRGALVLSADQSAFSGAFDVREGLLNFASSTPLAIGGGLSVDGASAPPPASGAPLLTPTASVHVNSELSIGKPATATAASSDLYLGQHSALVFDNPSGNTLELAAGTGTGAARGASAAIHGVLAGVGDVRVGAYGRLVIGASALGAEALQNGSSTNPGLSRRPAVTPSGNVTIGADAELAIGRELGLQTAGILSFEGSSGVTPGDDHRSVLNLTAYQNEATYVIARALSGISIAGSLPGSGNLSQLRVTAGGRSIPVDNVDVGAPLGFIVADVRIVNFNDSDFTGSSVPGANSATQEIQVNAALAWYNANTANAHGIFNVAENNSFVLGHRPDYDEAARPGGLLQDRAESAVFTGDIGGVGSSWNGRSLTKSGKGELVLYRANDYTGKTEVLDGVLTLQSVDAAGVYAGTDAAVDVKTSSSVLRFDLRQHENPADTGTYDRPVDGTYARVIGGYGDVEKLNSGTLVLSSRQAYSGTTRVLGGTLAITAGPDALASSGRVEIASGASLDYSGATGSGPVVLKNLDGAPGSSLVLPAGGLLDVGQTGGVNTGSGTFGGALDVSHLTSGVIPVIAKRGGGTFSLAGDYSALSASLVVHEGVLSVEDAALNLSGARLTLNAPATRFEATTPGSTPLRLLSLDGVLGSVLRFEAHSLWVASGGTFGGTLYGAGELRVLGGRLTLAGDNSTLFSGRATIREGTLALDGAGSLSNAAAIEIAPQGALTASFDISGATPTGGAPVVVRSLTSSSASLPDEISPQSQSIVVLGANTLRVSGAGVQGGVRFRGVIKGQGGLEKAGPHELLLSNTQGYAGLTKVEDGVLTLAGAGSIGASAGLALTGQDARFDASQVTGSAALRSLSGVAGSSIAAGTARLLVGGLDETLAGESAPGSYGDGSGLFAGTISGLNGLVKGGSGVLELTAAQAALRGGVLVEAGTLRLAGESGLPNASGLSLATGALLDIATHLDAPGGAPEVTLKNLSGGAGAVRLGSNTLRVDGGASSSFDGEFSGDVDSLLLVGSPASNVLRLTGASTGFLGEVRVAPGAALALSGSFASAKGLSLGELATAGLSGTGSGVWRNLDMAADSRVDAGANPVSLGTSGGQDGAGTIAGVIAGTSTLGKHGSGLLTVLVPQEITGLVTLHEGSLKIAGTGSLSSAAGLHLGAHTILNLGDVSSGRAVLRNLTSDAQAPGAVAHLGGIELTVGVKDLPGTGGGTLGAVLDGASGSVVKTGPGTLTLTAVNDYAGATRVEQGTLALAGQGGIASSSRLTLEAGAGFDASALASGTTVLKSITAGAGSDVSLGGGTLTLQIGASGTDTGDSLFAGILRGAASTRLLKDGPGELVVVSGNSATFSGRVSVVDGSLLLRDLGGVGGGAITVDGSLGLLAGGTFANVIDGYGDVRAAGAAQAPVRVTLGTANTGFGGSFSVGANATLFAPAPGSLGMPTVALNLSSGGALELGGTAFDLDTRPVTLGPGGGSMLLAPGLSATLSGVLSGAADAPLSIVAAGAGVAPSLTLLSVAPLQGAVNVEGARLLLSQGGSLAASAGLGLSGAVLDISGLDATATGLARLDGDAGSVVELGDGRTLAIGQGVFSGVFSGTDSTLVKTQAASSGNLLALTNPDALRGFSGTLRVTAGGGTLALAVTRLPVALDIGADATLRLEPAAGSVLDFSGATGAAGAAFAANATLDIRSGSFALPDAARLLSAGAVLAIGPGATGLAGSPADMAGKRLSFQGGSLLFGSTLLAPETPLQNLAQLDATGGGRVLLPLGSSLPAASLPDPALNVFDLAAAPEMRQVLLIQADGVTLPGQLELRDENGAVFSQPVRRELVDAGGETLGAFYFAHAVSLDGSNASPASRGLYLGYGLDRVEAGSGKVVRLDSTGARNAAPAVLARLSGLGGFEITGAAGQSVLVGNGLNDYAGPTRIAAPAGGSYTVRLVADSALGRTRSITLDGAAVLDMGGRAQATGTLSGPAESAIVLGSLTLEDGTYAGRISGGLAADAVSLRKTGPGVLHLGGAADYSGVTHVSGGTLRFGGTLGAGAAGAPNVHTGEFRLDAGATLGFATAAGERLDGVISGGGSLLQDGPGVLHVASPLNTYSGGTRVTGGVLLARSITALGTGVTTIDSAVPALSDGSPVAAAATLAFDLSGALWERPVEFAGNGGVLRLDSDAAFGSPGMGGFTGAGALVKTGAGTLTLGARNTLRGAVDVFDGRLALATADSLALASGLSLHAGSSATAAQPQTFQSLVLDAGATYDSAGMALTLHAGSAAGVDLLNVATLTKAGEGVLSIASSFAAPLVVNGALDVQSGTLRLAFDPDGAVVKAGSVSFSADATIDVGGYDLGAILGADASILIATNSAIPAASLPKKYLFDGHEPAATDYATLQFTNAPAGFGSGLYISASLRWNDIHIDDAGKFDLADGVFDITGEHLFTYSLADRQDFAGKSAVGWDGRTLTKRGVGTLILAVPQYYTGDTRVEAGVLRVGDAAHPSAALGARDLEIGGDYVGTIRVASGASVVFNQSVPQVLRGGLAELSVTEGAAPLVEKSGPGTLTFLGTVAFSRGTIRNTEPLSVLRFEGAADIGTLELRGDAVFASETASAGRVSLNGSARLEVAPGSSLAVTGEFTLAGTPSIALAPGATLRVSAPFETSSQVGLEVGPRALFVLGAAARIGSDISGGGLIEACGATFEAQNVTASLTVSASTAATLSGTLTGALSNSGSADIGAVTGDIENSGRLRLRQWSNGSIRNNAGAVLESAASHGGDVHNSEGALLSLDAGRSRTDIAGALYNSGTVRFGNLGHTLGVRVLHNEVAGVAGFFDLETDYGAAANSDRVVLDPSTPVADHDGSHVLYVRAGYNKSAATSGTRIPLVATDGAPLSEVSYPNATFVLDPRSDTDAGLYHYVLQDAHTPVLRADGYSGTVTAAANFAAAVSPAWFAQTDNLLLQLVELRSDLATSARDAGEKASTAPGGGAGDAKSAAFSALPATSSAFWLRAYARQLDTDLGVANLPDYRANQYGADVGYDAAFLVDNARLHIGGFAGYQTTRIHLRDNRGGKGDADSAAFGLYAAYVRPDGWFATAIAQGQTFDVDYTATTAATPQGRENAHRGQYEDLAAGLAFELGKRISLPLPHSLHLEPTFNLAWTHVIADSYSTTIRAIDDAPLQISPDDADVFRAGAALRLGAAFALGGVSTLHPYVRASLAYETSSGGGITATARGRDESARLDPNVDGLRGSIGLGAALRLTSSQSLQLDYEATYGAKYTIPYSITVSYRHRF
jgi:outer membrane autotransporter protein